MRVSSKITRSFYYFLRARGFDVSRFFELTALEVEFIKDSSRWLPANKVESLLSGLSKEYASYFVDQDFMTCVGHACFRLSGWGALDSVLKMKTDKSLFSHLPVFMSYFVENCYLTGLKKERGKLSCQCNISSEEYPFITGYLRAVLESLPLYTGDQLAAAKWVRYDIQIQWEDSRQTSLFHPGAHVHFKPELLSDFRKFLDNLEEDMRFQKKLLRTKDKEIARLKHLLLSRGITLPEGEREPEQESH